MKGSERAGRNGQSVEGSFFKVTPLKSYAAGFEKRTQRRLGGILIGVIGVVAGGDRHFFSSFIFFFGPIRETTTTRPIKARPGELLAARYIDFRARRLFNSSRGRDTAKRKRRRPEAKRHKKRNSGELALRVLPLVESRTSTPFHRLYTYAGFRRKPRKAAAALREHRVSCWASRIFRR